MEGPEGWRTDPTGRNDQRWWDGERWTDRVLRTGMLGTDPLDGPEPDALGDLEPDFRGDAAPSPDEPLEVRSWWITPEDDSPGGPVEPAVEPAAAVDEQEAPAGEPAVSDDDADEYDRGGLTQSVPLSWEGPDATVDDEPVVDAYDDEEPPTPVVVVDDRRRRILAAIAAGVLLLLLLVGLAVALGGDDDNDASTTTPTTFAQPTTIATVATTTTEAPTTTAAAAPETTVTVATVPPVTTPVATPATRATVRATTTTRRTATTRGESQVANFTGSGSEQTSAFTIASSASEWFVKWQFSGDEANSVELFRSDGTPVARLTDGTGDNRGQTRLTLTGRFFLRVTGGSWTVNVTQR